MYKLICLFTSVCWHKGMCISLSFFFSGIHWRAWAMFGIVIQCNAFEQRDLLCIMIVITLLMQKQPDISGKKGDSLKLSFPAVFNPSHRADFCVHQNTASCVLRHSKRSSCLKTTCPAGSWKNLPKSCFLQKLKMYL